MLEEKCFVYNKDSNLYFILDILMEELQVKEDVITLDAELASDLGINSIELADLVMLCEEKFDLTIEDEDLHSFITVGDVVEYLENHA